MKLLVWLCLESASKKVRAGVQKLFDKERTLQMQALFFRYKCKISSLKRHLQEQHKIFDLEKPIQTKDPGEYMCNLCDKGFKRKEHLKTI